MEVLLHQQQDTDVDKDNSVSIDIQSMVQFSDRGAGSPKMTKALSRKGSNRTERRNAEDAEVDEGSKNLPVKGTCSQTEIANQVTVQNRTLACQTTISLTVAGEGKCKRFNRLTGFRPRKILLLFATMSCLGTMILIYFTLAINQGDLIRARKVPE